MTRLAPTQACLVALALTWGAGGPIAHAADSADSPGAECSRPSAWKPTGALDTLIDEMVCRLDRRFQGGAKGEKVGLRLSVKGLGKNLRSDDVALTLLKWRLERASNLRLTSKAKGLLRIGFSERRGLVRIKAEVVAMEKRAPFLVVVEKALDSELEEALGLAARGSRMGRIRRQTLLATNDVVLDLVLMNTDDIRGDEAVFLFPDGVQVFGLAPDGHELVPRGDRVPLDAPNALLKHRWPALMTGWLAEAGRGQVLLATSAGHSMVLDLNTGARQGLGGAVAPLRQVGRRGEDSFILLAQRPGSAALVGPPLLPSGLPVQADGLSQALGKRRVRDLVSWPEKNLWLWVGDDGRMGQYSKATRFSLPDEAVGDRFVVADLDGDGLRDLITTGAKKPDDDDALSIFPLEVSGASNRRPLRINLRPAGSIAAIAAGDLDDDGTTDLVVVQAAHDSAGQLRQMQVWRLEGER
jgi:hypothetical protein